MSLIMGNTEIHIGAKTDAMQHSNEGNFGILITALHACGFQ
jgi:hypothetical protein